MSISYRLVCRLPPPGLGTSGTLIFLQLFQKRAYCGKIATMAFPERLQTPTAFSSDPEENLIQRLRNGDQTALEEIFRAHYDALFRFTLGLIHSRDDVEDLLQDIFVRIWLNRVKWSPKGSVKAYLFKAARNQAINFTKGKAARGSVDVQDEEELAASSDARADPAEDNDWSELSNIVEKAIAKLPEKRRLVFVLNRQEGLSYSEIADVLSISEKTVENQIAKALRLLRRDLAPLLERNI